MQQRGGSHIRWVSGLEGGETMNDSIVDLAWLFCKRAKEKGMGEDDIRWVLDRVLERFDAFECLTRLSLESIIIEEVDGHGLGQPD
jgi:hypothetical protein